MAAELQAAVRQEQSKHMHEGETTGGMFQDQFYSIDLQHCSEEIIILTPDHQCILIVTIMFRFIPKTKT